MLNLTNPNGAPPNPTPLLLDPTTGAPATAITLQDFPNPGFQGLPEVLIARVSPFNAAGSVEFKDGTTDLGSVTVRAGLAIMVTTTPTLTTGTHALTALFTPTDPGAFAPSTSPPVTLTVNKLF